MGEHIFNMLIQNVFTNKADIGYNDISTIVTIIINIKIYNIYEYYYNCIDNLEYLFIIKPRLIQNVANANYLRRNTLLIIFNLIKSNIMN